MRSILTVSFIGCIISASFALNDQNSKLNKRQLPQVLGTVTGGGIGNLGNINGVGGVLGGPSPQSESKRQKRSLNKRGGLPVGLDGLLGGLPVVGGLTGGGAPAAVPQEAQPQQGRTRKHESRTKRGLPVGLDGLLGGLPVVGGLTGGGAPAAAPQEAQPQQERTRNHRSRTKRGRYDSEQNQVVAHRNRPRVKGSKIANATGAGDGLLDGLPVAGDLLGGGAGAAQLPANIGL